MEQEKKDLSIEEAKKMLDAEKDKRAADCGNELAELLKKYGCEIVPHLIIRAKDI